MRRAALAFRSPAGRSRAAVGGLLCLLATAPASAVELSPHLRLVARGPLPISHTIPITARIPGGATTLRGLGLTARELSSNVAALDVDRAALQWLAQQHDLDLHLEEQRIFVPTLDRAAALIGAPAARVATGLTGSGVLVGVADTGVDFRHPDLRNLDGTSRVQALLDLSLPADTRHPEIGSFGGPIWDRRELDAQLSADGGGPAPAVPVTSIDDEGHGTHVSSIATSNGYATARGLPAGRYVGIAPGADLVVVNARDASGNLTDANIVTACRFLVAEQAALGRPMVVNLSLGGPGGPHDGSTNVELALDELFPQDSPGRALVVAAGNDGGNDLHAGGWALDHELTVPFHVPSAQAGFEIEVWYRGALGVAIEDPSRERTEVIAPGDLFDKTGKTTRVRIDNATMGPGASGLSGVTIVLTDSTGKMGPEVGDYRILLSGHAIRWDAWVLGSYASFTGSPGSVDETDHLDSPATAKSAISVGALVSRFDWPTLDDGTYVVPGADPSALGGPAFFSSLGPTGDGRFAPDVSAPGEFVVAALSRDAPPTSAASDFNAGDPSLPPDYLIADDGLHGVLRGTSQATPMVTGTIALLLEAAPALTPVTIRELLRTSASTIAGTAGFSPRVGFGGVNVPAALALLQGVRGGTPSPSRSSVGLTHDLLPPGSEETTLVSVTPRDAAGVPLGPGHAVTIELGGLDMGLGPVRDVGAGRYERAFVAHATLGTHATVIATVDGVVLDEQPSVWFVPSRADIGGHLVAGNGCAFVGTPAGGHSFTWLAVLLIGLRRRAIRTMASCRPWPLPKTRT